MDILKKYWGWFVLSIALIALDIYHTQLFFSPLLFYGLFIKYLLSELITEKIRKALAIAIWTIFIVAGGLMFYVNHYMPHGPSYATGEVVCQNDGRGPCGEQYIEDTRKLNIPDWAKFFRTSSAELIMFGLLFAGIVASANGRGRN